MIQVRRGVFETNSSSTHTITMCNDETFKKFEDGELWYDCWSDKFVTFENIKAKYPEVHSVDDIEHFCDGQYQTWETFGGNYYEVFHDSFTTNSGEVVHAFGYFGYDS